MLLSINEESKSVPKKKRKKKRRVIIPKVILLLICIVTLLGVVSIGGYALYVIKTAPPIDPTKINDMLDDSSFIYDSQGNLLDKLSGEENRTIVPLSQIPEDLQNAVIATEDERFRQHNGVDIKRIFGALWYDVKNRTLEQGASTITMQLSKNMFTNSTRSLDRKIMDAYYAVEMEKILSKDQILAFYLNKVNFGRGSHGVQAAANHYFNKDVSDLSLAESAMIAGITQNPSKYSVYITAPISLDDDLSQIQIRQFLRSDNTEDPPTEEDLKVIDKLYSAGLISRYEQVQLKNNDYYVRKATLNPAAKERQETVLSRMLRNGYISQQEYLDAKSEEIVIKIGKTKASNISSYFADKVKTETLNILKSLGHSEEKAAQMLASGGLRIYSTMDPKVQRILEDEVNNNANYPRTRTDEQGILQPQVAGVVMENATGYVRGLVGGRGIGGSKIYNRALNPRQPGSAIKPLAVYLPALSRGFTPATSIDDKPFTEGNYRPKNFGNYYVGPTTVRNLVIHSSNVGAVQVAQKITPHVMIEELQKLGISTVVTRDMDSRTNDENLSLALGGMTKGATPLDMTAAYATIANGGTYTKPIFVKRIDTSSGTILYEAKPETKTVATPQEAYLMTSMLQDVVNRGTGARARVSGHPTAGKTGTTNDDKDIWFVGYTAHYTGAIWIGEDLPKSLNTTSDIPSALWGKVMNKVHAGLSSKSFAMPSGIVGLQICEESGLQATEYCPSTRKELFISGTTPKDSCDMHQTPEEEPLDPEDNPLISGEDDNGEIGTPGDNNGNGQTPPPTNNGNNSNNEPTNPPAPPDNGGDNSGLFG